MSEEFDIETFCASVSAEEIPSAVCAVYSAVSGVGEGLNVFFLLFAGTLVFMMQSGFAMLCAGSVRQKNVKNIMLKNLLDACGGAIGFYTIGYAFAYGNNNSGSKTFIGTENFFIREFSTGPEYIGFFFQFAFAATAATIVAGTVAERCKMAAYLCYSIFLTGFVSTVVLNVGRLEQKCSSTHPFSSLLLFCSNR
jgi:ammonium transporter, Amt family